MNPLLNTVRSSSAAELAAFDAVCDALCGFDDALGFERVDGLLCALAATPVAAEPDEWLPALFGDSFERAFADPHAHAQALQALTARLSVLRGQLDPEALFDQPDYLRLDPLMAEWSDEERAKLVEAGDLSVADAALLQTGSEWAEGFLDAVDALPRLWALPAHDEAEAVFAQSFDHIGVLLLPPDHADYKAHMERAYPKGEPSRDELLGEACMSVQDLRMYWVDFAPKPGTRRVEATPGRNDACPCGSGRKFKKCHGGA